MSDLSEWTPLVRTGDASPPSRRPSPVADEPPPRPPEVPWRIAVVEAWFARARQAGLRTIEQRRRARLARERRASPSRE